jgi:hypothetical protein
VKGRRGKRRKQLLDDLKERRGYWKLEEEALDRTVWRTRFGRGCGPVVRQNTKLINRPEEQAVCGRRTDSSASSSSDHAEFHEGLCRV